MPTTRKWLNEYSKYEMTEERGGDMQVSVN